MEEGIKFLETTQKATRAQKIGAQLRQNIASEAPNMPFISTRKSAAERNISHTSVGTILREQGMKFGKIHRETHLPAENKQKRLSFSKEMLAKRAGSPRIPSIAMNWASSYQKIKIKSLAITKEES